MTLVNADTGEIIVPDQIVSADEQRLAAMEAHGYYYLKLKKRNAR